MGKDEEIVKDERRGRPRVRYIDDDLVLLLRQLRGHE